jgi:hypothetical protein
MKPSKTIVLKNLKEKEPEELWETWWFKALLRLGAPMVKVINYVPLLRRFNERALRYIESTSYCMLMDAYRMLKEKKYEEVLSICTDGLLRFRNKTGSSAHYEWWQFMRYAVSATNKLNDIDKKAQLISLAEDGFPPFKGNGVAGSFCIFARWRSAEGDYKGAIEYAYRAKDADETYADAHYLLGWYSLSLGEADPIEHFRNAIKHDIGYLQLITNDPLVSEYPLIIKRLKKLMLLRDERKP